MDAPGNSDVDVSYEMSALGGPSQPETPALSAQSSMAALRAVDPHGQEGVSIQELPPVDRGLGAWAFCASGCVLEMMVWGFGFRLVSTSYGPSAQGILLTEFPLFTSSYGIFQCM